MTAKTPKQQVDRTKQVAITERRRQVFLDTLRKTGSSYYAASVATPWAKGQGGGYSGFRDLAARDPIFAEEWKRAEMDFIGNIEAEIARRVSAPHRRPIVSQGRVVAHEDVPADPKLLMFLLERMHHTKWGRKIEVQGEVQHTHRHAHLGVMLSADDLYLLPDDRRQQFIDLLAELTEAKERLEAQTERPAPLAVTDERPTVSAPPPPESGDGERG